MSYETDAVVAETPATGLVQMNQNCRCDHCNDIFGTPKQVRSHLTRKHKALTTEWSHTNEPVNRKAPDWKARLDTQEANKALVGPFKCNECGFMADNVRGIACHIGHHKGRKGTGPFVEGKDFEALGTAKGKRGPYKKQQSVGSQVQQALTGGQPTITIDIPLSEDITIRVPLTLGPPVFIERVTNA